METKLVIIEGKASKDQISVKLPTTIGRSREAGLTVAHPMISRQHCELFELDGLLKIRDLESLNGTFIGKEQIGEAGLLPNAQFTVGPLTFRVEYEYSGDPNTVAPPEPPAKALESMPFASDEEAQVAEEQEPLEQTPVAEIPEPASAPAPGIAPIHGELPDFSSWGAEDSGQVEEEEQEEEPVPAPPPPSVSESPTPQVQTSDEPDPNPLPFFEEVTPFEEELASEEEEEEAGEGEEEIINDTLPPVPPSISTREERGEREEEELPPKPPEIPPTLPDPKEPTEESLPAEKANEETNISDFLESMSSESDDDDLNEFFRGIQNG